MKLTEIYNTIVTENSNNNTINLYHGTCFNYAEIMLKSGWAPNKVISGGNFGNPNYLYLSSGKEDAEWYAEEKGCSTILFVKNIPIEYLIPDPEDEAGYTMQDLLDDLKNPFLPRKFALTKSLPSNHFELIQR